MAEEICQDVFLKVYLNIAKFEGRSSLKTWIYTIARNTYFDYVRKTKKEVVIEDLENYTSDLVDKDMGPEEHATKIATRELIEKL